MRGKKITGRDVCNGGVMLGAVLVGMDGRDGKERWVKVGNRWFQVGKRGITLGSVAVDGKEGIRKGEVSKGE